MRWVLIGASTIADEWMVAALRAVGDSVVGVVSGNAKRAQEFAHKHQLAHYSTDLATTPNWGVDAAYVSSINDLHEAQVLFAAQQGWHVLCEKPLATDLGAAARMVKACQQAGVVLGTNHHLRHNHAHRLMRDYIQAGELGELVAARVHHAVYLREQLQGWRVQNKSAGGGVVLDIAVHNADSLAFLLNEYPQTVVAMTSSAGMGQGVEDNALSLWRFASGMIATTHQAFTTPFAEVGLEIHGTRGSLHGIGIMHQRADGQLRLRTASGERSLPLEKNNLYEMNLQHFHRACQQQAHDMADGQAGYRSLAVALALQDSAAQGRLIALSLNRPDAD